MRGWNLRDSQPGASLSTSTPSFPQLGIPHSPLVPPVSPVDFQVGHEAAALCKALPDTGSTQAATAGASGGGRGADAPSPAGNNSAGGGPAGQPPRSRGSHRARAPTCASRPGQYLSSARARTQLLPHPSPFPGPRSPRRLHLRPDQRAKSAMGGATHKPHPPRCCRALTCTPAARVPWGGFKRGEGRGQDGGKGRGLRTRVIFSVGERRVPTDTQKA